MDLTLKYTPVQVKDPESVKDFLLDFFGFIYWRKAFITGNLEGIIVGLNVTDPHRMLLVNGGPGSAGTLIINTDDCLKDYNELLQKGISPGQKPQYTAMGLAVTIEDASGNKYVLLEEREYEENKS
ncbi:VOC family protein [Hufsiella ginkgonis]|uniref:VOC domain-containing protein n=1 Tax=Hufsiella ginkgonis TaxID=2695274 RepID=A0A7K1Y2X9_9SPHI|nr:VOC family protein [Hufsiella ginkgonis]MXV17036.1 hypothetical protein [Hufsiella ginkgonis]